VAIVGDDIQRTPTAEQHADYVQEQVQLEAVANTEKYRATLQEVACSDGEELHAEYSIVGELVESLLKSKETHSLILVSQPGLGKTYSLTKKLNSIGKVYDRDYIMVSGHITPMKLYEKMYRFREGLIFVDDVLAVFKNEDSKSLLLDATQTEQTRMVQYESSSRRLEQLGLPNRFLFNGKVVFCTNTLPTDPRTTALKSRSYYKEISFSYKEKIELIEKLAARRKVPAEVVKFIKENTDESFHELSLRTLLQVNDWFNNCKHWEAVAANTLGLIKDNELKMIKAWEESGVPTREQERLWRESTGKCRASFFNKKKLLRPQGSLRVAEPSRSSLKV
jgi:hypothetical protein